MTPLIGIMDLATNTVRHSFIEDEVKAVDIIKDSRQSSMAVCACLRQKVIPSKYGQEGVDFSRPSNVMNRAMRLGELKWRRDVINEIFLSDDVQNVMREVDSIQISTTEMADFIYAGHANSRQASEFCKIAAPTLRGISGGNESEFYPRLLVKIAYLKMTGILGEEE